MTGVMPCEIDFIIRAFSIGIQELDLSIPEACMSRGGLPDVPTDFLWSQIIDLEALEWSLTPNKQYRLPTLLSRKVDDIL